MHRLVTLLVLIGLLSPALPGSNRASADSPGATRAEFQPSAEMQRLQDKFAGEWTVSETFEVSESRQGKTRQGTASFRLGPGSSLIENY